MLAPIALYPDQLLMQVLMAATFPQQVIDAGQWLQDPSNAALHGDALASALEPLPWDPSVKSVVAFPQIIVMMNTHMDWTQALGVAFASQQVAVMSEVQTLRNRAAAANQFHSNSQVRYVHQGSIWVIEPVNPGMIYVPVYNPAVVYGHWAYPDYPPIYVPPPPGFVAAGFTLGAGIAFSVGFGVVAPLWGWGHPDWRRHEVVVDQTRYGRITHDDRFQENHITIQNNTWHRTAPVAIDRRARRAPAPATRAAPAGHRRRRLRSMRRRPVQAPREEHQGPTPAQGQRPARPRPGDNADRDTANRDAPGPRPGRRRSAPTPGGPAASGRAAASGPRGAPAPRPASRPRRTGTHPAPEPAHHGPMPEVRPSLAAPPHPEPPKPTPEAVHPTPPHPEPSKPTPEAVHPAPPHPEAAHPAEPPKPAEPPHPEAASGGTAAPGRPRRIRRPRIRRAAAAPGTRARGASAGTATSGSRKPEAAAGRPSRPAATATGQTRRRVEARGKKEDPPK